MKHLVLSLFIMTGFAQAAHADLNYQLNNIIGAWDLGARANAVYLIHKQTETRVKSYSCDRAEYISSGRCSYSSIWIYEYNARYDGFCSVKDKVCEAGLQVSPQYSSELLETVDPLQVFGFSNSGYTREAKKL